MKLAVVSPGYAPDLGGVESVVSSTCRLLARRGVTVEVWTHGRETGVTDVEGVRVRRFRTTQSHRFPVAPALWRHARRHAAEFDVVHAHSFHSSAPIAVLFAARDVPVAYSPHYHGVGHTALARLVHVPYRGVAARLFTRAQVIVAVSETEHVNVVADHPSVRGRTTVIRNAIDVEAIHRAEPFAGQRPTVLVLGRLERYKHVDLVIGAFARVAANADLVIVGDGPDRERLEQLAARSDRANDIRFLGRIAREEVDRWLRTARCVVSMSEHEAFGIVGLEAVGAGADAVLSDIAAHREVALLAGSQRCSIVSRDELVSALRRTLAGQRGSPHLVRDWDSVAAEHLALYQRLTTP